MNKAIQTLALTAVAVALSSLTACQFSCIRGSGHQATENLKVGDFTRLDIAGGFKVNLRQDSSLNVSLTADDNLLKNVDIQVSGNRLRIHNRKSVCNTGEMVLNIGVRNLEEIRASGAVEVNGQGKINTHDLALNLSGATRVNMDLNAGNVTSKGSGSTEIHLSGQATSHNIDLSGSGKLYAFDFVAGAYNIITTGASECQINVLKSLKVHTSGASEIQYKGNPTEVSDEKSGASSVTKVN